MDALPMAVSIIFTALLITHVYCGHSCDYYDPEWLQHDPQTYDPCLEGNHHLITDETRSVDYYDPDASLIYDDYDYFYKDGPLEKNGWYRSMIPGAEDIALKRPEYGQCQTDLHWYFNAADYPIDNYNDEYYAVYLTYDDGCCSDYVCVKQCDYFNVYQLGANEYHHHWIYETEGRLCFGGDGACQVGYDECEQLFGDRNRAEISHILNEKQIGDGKCREEITFVCQMEKWVNNTDIAVLQFTWSVGDETILWEQKQGPDSLSTLTSEVIFLKGISKQNFQLKCSIQWTRGASSIFGNAVSTIYDVASPDSTSYLWLREGQKPGNIQLTSSLPIECEYLCAESDTHNCEVEVTMSYPVSARYEIAYHSDNTGEQYETCDTSLKLRKFVQGGVSLNLPIRIYPKDDGKYDGTQVVDVQLELASVGNLWNGMAMDSKVVVLDMNRWYGSRGQCLIYNDPHAWSFDGNRFELQLEGIFTLFQHTKYPIDIEGYFKSFGRYTGVCGVAVRSGGDLYVLITCRSPIIAKYYQCDSNNPSLKVHRRGKYYYITLPTGMRVKYGGGRINIFPSAADRGNSEGICGNYNGNPNDDFINRNTGTIHNAYARYPNAFSNSWRVKVENSGFKGIINGDSRSYADEFCECDEDGVEICSPLPVQFPNNRGSTVLPVGSCGSKKRSVEYSDFVDDEEEYDFDFDPDFVAPTPEWTNGWVQSSAEDFCNDYFLTNELLQSCGELIDTEGVLESCVDDIYYTGTTDYAKLQFDMLLDQCVEEAEKYNFVSVNSSSSEYENPYINILQNVCPSDCNGNGICDDGICHCHGNFSGHDCSLDKNYVPSLHPFQREGICDKLSRPCQTTGVFADLFLETENLKCQVQVINLADQSTLEPVVYDGVLEHYQKVFCSIPDHKLPYMVGISVSNNNRDYSEPKHLIIYHSTCWDCTLEGGCIKKKSSCVIDGACFDDGESNPVNAKEYCNPDANEFDWSTGETSTTGRLSTGAIIGIVLASVVGLLVTIFLTVLASKKICKKENSPRVASELNLQRTHAVHPKALEDTENGAPPSQAYVDLNALKPHAGIKPFNRLEPLSVPPAGEIITVQQGDDSGQANPMPLQKDALPPLQERV